MGAVSSPSLPAYIRFRRASRERRADWSWGMVMRLAERAWDISARSTTLTKPSGYMITSARRSVTMRVFVFSL